MKFRVFWDVAPCSHVEVADVSEVRTASIIRMIALMMRAVFTSDMSVSFNVITRLYISGDSKLHADRRENLKYHIQQTSVSALPSNACTTQQASKLLTLFYWYSARNSPVTPVTLIQVFRSFLQTNHANIFKYDYTTTTNSFPIVPL
jgi:hypothetical protein